MTRARQTLTLATLNRAHPLLAGLEEQSSVLVRAAVELPAPAPELARQYVRATLGDVDLGFAGRFAPAHAVHTAIAKLSEGDALSIGRRDDRFELIDGGGNLVGRLARAFTPPKGAACVQVRVAAVVQRLRGDSDPEYEQLLKCDRWEVVVPELVFEPIGGNGLRRGT
jgi:ATP-dependent DNA helicase RecQ